MLPSDDSKKMLPSPCILFEDNFAKHDPYWKYGSDDGKFLYIHSKLYIVLTCITQPSEPTPNRRSLSSLGSGASWTKSLKNTRMQHVDLFPSRCQRIFVLLTCNWCIVVHITTHAGWIEAFCRVLGRAPYSAINAGTTLTPLFFSWL